MRREIRLLDFSFVFVNRSAGRFRDLDDHRRPAIQKFEIFESQTRRLKSKSENFSGRTNNRERVPELFPLKLRKILMNLWGAQLSKFITDKLSSAPKELRSLLMKIIRLSQSDCDQAKRYVHLVLRGEQLI